MSIFSKMEKNSDIFWENNNLSQQKMSIFSKMEKNSDKILGKLKTNKNFPNKKIVYILMSIVSREKILDKRKNQTKFWENK
jgi:hypothetical protein